MYEKGMVITRQWAMPNKWTFTIKPIKELLDRYVSGYSCDPFAGENSPATIQNDLSGNVEFCMDAIDFLKSRKDEEFDVVLLDPPYSKRQISEHYKKAGIPVTGWHTSMAWGATIKNEASRILKPRGIVMCFGWNSMGLGKNRGFEMIEILLVPHGGSKNDTIVTVERKLR
jgi:tRNA1(Val) A37 N6-methylase TrmN6